MGFMSAILSIIVAIVVLIFYVARSVEKQNEQENRRRAMRRPGPAIKQRPPDRQARPKEKKKPLQNEAPRAAERSRSDKTGRQMNRGPGAQEMTRKGGTGNGNDLASRYRTLQKRLNQEAASPGEQAVSTKAIRPFVKQSAGQALVKNRGQLREAFLFSECIAEPRAKRPHPSIK